MNVGKSLAESIEGATTAYYRDGGGTETGIAADERLVEALKQAYIAAYARNDGGSLDNVKNELAEFGGREPTTNEICEAAIALAGKQAKQDAGVISRMFKLQAGIASGRVCACACQGLRCGTRSEDRPRHRARRKRCGQANEY